MTSLAVFTVMAHGAVSVTSEVGLAYPMIATLRDAHRPPVWPVGYQGRWRGSMPAYSHSPVCHLQEAVFRVCAHLLTEDGML